MRIKVCGLCRPRDAAWAAEAGATHAGVIRVPGTPRFRALDEARQVLDAAAGLRRVGVFADTDSTVLLEEAAALGLDVAQLHGDEDPGVVDALRAAGLEVWKVVKPADGPALLAAASRYAGADLLLVEGTSDRGAGGVGARFDWEAMAAVRDRLPAGTRLGAAGGLTPENVARAIRRLRPDLVDVSSGVEASPGVKDERRVRAFIAAAVAEGSAIRERKGAG